MDQQQTDQPSARADELSASDELPVLANYLRLTSHLTRAPMLINYV